jgi:hypothetical protein
MVEKISKVSNPLTIIAIFAALSEIAATTALAFIAKELQPIFIWFVMLFPFILVSAFFFTLNKNPKVFYAPSDFKDDKSYLMLNEVMLKTENELIQTDLNKTGNIPSIEIIEYIVTHINQRVLEFILKAANKRQNISELFTLFIKTFKFELPKEDPSKYSESLTQGVTLGIITVLNGILFQYVNMSIDSVELQVSKEILEKIQKQLAHIQ